MVSEPYSVSVRWVPPALALWWRALAQGGVLRIVPHRVIHEHDKCLYSWVDHPLMNWFLRGPFGCLCCTIKYDIECLKLASIDCPVDTHKLYIHVLGPVSIMCDYILILDSYSSTKENHGGKERSFKEGCFWKHHSRLNIARQIGWTELYKTSAIWNYTRS